MTVPAMRASNLRKHHGKTEILKGLSLDVMEGEVHALIGPSGAGKSTFLRCINQLETYQHGSIEVFGERIGERVDNAGRTHALPDRQLSVQRSHIGMVFQKFNLFSHKTVLENLIEAPQVVKKMPRAEALDLAMGLLEQVGLAQRSTAFPRELSGGQQQRIAIARALAMQPRLLLLDEPTSALDPELVRGVVEIIEKLRLQNLTMIVVTHEMSFTQKIADKVVLMEDGTIVDQGSPEYIFSQSTQPRTCMFLNSV